MRSTAAGHSTHDAQSHSPSLAEVSSLPPPRHKHYISKARTLDYQPNFPKPLPHSARFKARRLRPKAPRLCLEAPQLPRRQEPSSWDKSTDSQDRGKVGLGGAAGLGLGVGVPVSLHVLLHSRPELAQGRRERGTGWSSRMLPLAVGPRAKGERGVTGVRVLTWQLGSVVARLGLGSQRWPLSAPIAEGPSAEKPG